MVKLGVVGFGSRISGLVNTTFPEVNPEVRVAAVVDPDEAGVRARLSERDRGEVVFYQTLDEMVRGAKIDALMIGTRDHLHTPYAIQAAKYDLPLFLEKPVAISMDQAIALERAFENSRCQVVISFPLRVSSLCTLARKHIEDGAVGSPEHILAINYVNYGTVYFDCSHYRDFSITRGLFLQKATHDIDYMSYLMGSTITRVAAMASWGRVFGGKKPAGLICSQCDETETCLESPQSRERNQTSWWPQADQCCVFSEDLGTPETGMNEDSSSALVEFASGAKGVYTQVFFTRRDAGARGATVSGYHGTLSFDWTTNQLRLVHHHTPSTDVMKQEEGASHYGGDHELAKDFLALIQDNTPSCTPIQVGIQSIYTCLAAKESAETGKFVKVRQVGAAM